MARPNLPPRSGDGNPFAPLGLVETTIRTSSRPDLEAVQLEVRDDNGGEVVVVLALPFALQLAEQLVAAVFAVAEAEVTEHCP